MRKNRIISISIAGVIIAVIGLISYFAIIETEKSKDVEVEWLTSGPFSLQRYQHKLGENIYFIARDIAPHEKGMIRVYTPKNVEFASYPFDGSAKSQFNQYFKPDTIARKDRCSPEDLVGVWTMKFEGVNYPPIQFEFINEYIIGGEADITNLCKGIT